MESANGLKKRATAHKHVKMIGPHFVSLFTRTQRNLQEEIAMSESKWMEQQIRLSFIQSGFTFLYWSCSTSHFRVVFSFSLERGQTKLPTLTLTYISQIHVLGSSCPSARQRGAHQNAHGIHTTSARSRRAIPEHCRMR